MKQNFTIYYYLKIFHITTSSSNLLTLTSDIYKKNILLQNYKVFVIITLQV